MKVYDAASLRNVALVGHSGSGKTQLVSALLYSAGAVNRLGKVDDGTTVTDYDEEEIARKHTLSASIAYAEWNKTKINFIDTPGMANFLSDARASLRVADCALVVVDAVHGAEVSTEKVWAVCEELAIPRIVILNRMDRERANLDRSLASLRGVFGRTVIPIQLPIGEEKGFKGVVDLVAMKAYTFATDGSGKPTEGEVPGDLTAAAQTAREALIEMVAEADDAADGEVLRRRHADPGGARRRTEARRRGGRVFPVVLRRRRRTSAWRPCSTRSSPTCRRRSSGRCGRARADGDTVEIATSESGPTAAFVWKTVADQFAGRITLFRVISGTVKSDTTLHNLTKDAPERLGHLLVVQGKSQTNVGEIKAGDIGAVAKLKETQTSDVLADKGAATTIPADQVPRGGHLLRDRAEEPRRRGEDQHGASPPAGRRPDDQLHARRADEGAAARRPGTVAHRGHGREAEAPVRRRSDAEAAANSLPRDHQGAVEAHGRHKKQTGGHGQFGDCKVKFEPLPRGSDFEFVDDIFGGSIPRQFVPAMEKGIQDSRMRGFLAGYPMVDFRASVFDGSFHPVDSSEMSFKMAGSLAFKDGMSRARPTLLEPVMNVEVYAPSDFAGDLMGDLNSRRGRIGGMDTRGAIDGHPRQGADGGDAHLRAAPHVSHRRPRLVPHGVRPLRRSAVAPPRQDHRGQQGREGAEEPEEV